MKLPAQRLHLDVFVAGPSVESELGVVETQENMPVQRRRVERARRCKLDDHGDANPHLNLRGAGVLAAEHGTGLETLVRRCARGGQRHFEENARVEPRLAWVFLEAGVAKNRQAAAEALQELV